MKRRHLLDFETYGSVCAWDWSIEISRNERTSLWSVYLKGGHPDYPVYEPSSGNDAESILYWLEEKDCSIDEFCSALRRQQEPAFSELADEIESLKEIEE